MAGASINLDTPYIEIDDGGAVQAIENLIKLGANLEPPFKDIGEYLLERTEQRFDEETAPGGIEWQDVTPETRKRKKHPKILTETHRLRGSFSYEASQEELVFGTNVIYAATHQFGRDAIPARPFLGIDEDDGEELVAILLQYIVDAANDEL